MEGNTIKSGCRGWRETLCIAQCFERRLKDDTSANIVRDSPSPTDAEIVVASKKTNNGGDTELMQIDEEQGKDVDEQVNLKENTNEIDQGQAGSDPGITFESQPSPEQVVIDEDQARPDPGESLEPLIGPP
uniref:Uncharacterized protein n=1 Tax=Tanacetum cinerariifolium TaxID=118510 RepID=A0A6L2J7U9_TANCI|nr:hypothetical protein [Tanacetum cinerariifolium]